MTMPSPTNPAPHSLGASIEHLKAKAGWIIGLGAALMVLGALALIYTVQATVATVLINGWIMIVAGCVEIYMGSRAKDWRHFSLWVIAGVLYLAAGVMAIANPLLASVVFTLLLGAGLSAAGAVRLYLAFKLPASQARMMVMLSAFVTMALGVIVITGWPADSLWVLGTLLGVDLIFHGAGWISFGLGLKARK